jgi:hypothetical protein
MPESAQTEAMIEDVMVNGIWDKPENIDGL